MVLNYLLTVLKTQVCYIGQFLLNHHCEDSEGKNYPALGNCYNICISVTGWQQGIIMLGELKLIIVTWQL